MSGVESPPAPMRNSTNPATSTRASATVSLSSEAVYITKQIDGWSVRAAPELLDGEMFSACCRPGEDKAGLFQHVHSSKTTAVYRFTRQGRDYYLKHYLFENWKKYFSQRLNASRLMNIAQRLNAAGFSTPEIVCFARRGRQMFTVSAAADADGSVHALYTQTGGGTAADMSRFRERFGRETGRLHAAGFVHGDLRWGNVLVKDPGAEQPEFIYLDNDRTRRYRKIPARGRIRNLVQIHFPEIVQNHPPSNWEEFWRGYCSAEPAVAAREPYWRRKVERATARRVRNYMKKPDFDERMSRRADKDKG